MDGTRSACPAVGASPGEHHTCLRRCSRQVALAVLLSVLLLGPGSAGCSELVDLVRRALQQSDIALDLEDRASMSRLDVQAEEHVFEYRLIPLANIGVADDIGSQTLGMEVRQTLTTGTDIAVGLRGDRTDLNTTYAVENSHTARAYLRVSQGLFRKWGQKYNRSSLTIARLKHDEQSLANARQRQELILRTATEYYQLLLAKKLIAQSEQAVQRSRKHLAAAESRQSVGLVSKVDVYRAHLAALDAENNLHNERLTYVKAIDSLAELLGTGADEPFALAEEIALITPLVPEQWETALQENRLDWQAHLINKRYAALALFRARQDTLPDLYLNFNLQQLGEGDSFSQASSMNETDWSIQLEMQSSFDLFAEKTGLTRQQMAVRKLDREGAALRRKINREASHSFEELKAQERFYQINLERLKQAENALDLTKIRYERGLSDNLDVLDAELAYSSAEFDISRAMIGYNIAAINLAHALGVLDIEWLQISLK